MSDVTANNRTIVHRGDGLTNVAALPDVCKTPMPAGPTPVPYPNVARDGDLAKGAKQVTIAGEPVGHAGSEIARSSGDEAGTLGGVVSGKNRGKMTWGSSSPDVAVEGKGVVRFGDVTHHNCNTFNVVHVQGGSVVVVLYGDDAPCPLCGGAVHDPMQSKDQATSVHGLVDALIAKLQAQPNGGIRSYTDRRTKQIVKAGFMVGVVVTQCGEKYAACSGSLTEGPHNEFVDAAKQAGLIPCEGSGLAAMNQAMEPIAARSLGPAGEMLAASDPDEYARKLHDKIASLTETKPKGNPAGQCAAPRAISRALNDRHVPTMLCEKWFGPAGVRSTGVNVKDAAVRRFAGSSSAPPRLLSAGPEDVPRAHGSAVPSCTTCQSLVPVLLCYTRDEKCH